MWGMSIRFTGFGISPGILAGINLELRRYISLPFVPFAFPAEIIRNSLLMEVILVVYFLHGYRNCLDGPNS